MTTKFINSIYNAGYTLSGAYTAAVIGSTGGVFGVTGSGYSASGLAAFTAPSAATLTNNGFATGGAGTAGATSAGGNYPNTYYGGTGGEGGAGVVLQAGGRVVNAYLIFGGAGGAGGASTAVSEYGDGGTGGIGGVGLSLSAGGSVSNSDTIQGGAGGAGGAAQPTYYGTYVNIFHAPGYGGRGGAGIATAGAAATVVNTGRISGGAGGGNAYGNAGFGDGVDLALGGRVTNGSASDHTAIIYGGNGVYAAGAGVATITNFATIGGQTNFGFAIRLGQAADRVIAEASSVFQGLVLGAASTLELAGGAETLSGMGSTATVTGGVAMTLTGFASYVVDAPASLTLSGLNSLAVGGKLLDAGHLALAAGATLQSGEGATIEFTSSVVNAGSISLAGVTSLSQVVVLGTGATLSGGGHLSLGGAKARLLGATTTTRLVNVDNTITGLGSLGVNKLILVNQSKGVIEALGVGTLAISTQGQTLTNAGLLEAGKGATLAISSTTVANTGGKILALAGGKLSLTGDVIKGGTVGGAAGTIVEISTGGDTFDGSASAITLSSAVRVDAGERLTLNGMVANTGVLSLNATVASDCYLLIGAAGVSLSGKGSVTLSNAPGNRIYGLAAGDTLTNVDNTVSGAGQIGYGQMKLVNQAAGKIIANQAQPMEINTGSTAITNSGVIESDGTGGLLVDSDVVNTGTLLALAGTLTMAGTVSGAGTCQIKGATLWTQQVFSENVAFTGLTGVFEIGQSQAYAGTVTGLSKSGGNWLDLNDIVFVNGTTKATYSGTVGGGTLTVTEGTHVAHIKLAGNYLGSTFTVSSDGHGGTKVVDPQMAVAAAPLVQAMAGLDTRSSANVAIPPPWRSPPLHVLCVQA